MKNRPCVHAIACELPGNRNAYPCSHCEKYQPSLLPVLKRWKDLYDREAVMTWKKERQLSFCFMAQSRTLKIIIAHLEREGRNG